MNYFLYLKYLYASLSLSLSGRGADNFQKDPIILEVFSKGTVVTTYEQISETVQDRDKDGKVIGSHIETRTDKDETGRWISYHTIPHLETYIMSLISIHEFLMPTINGLLFILKKQ